jgi:putative membrane protein
MNARMLPLALGLLVLAAAWTGPLPQLASTLFLAHMAMHVSVVAVAAPLIAHALGGSRLDPLLRWPSLSAPLAASALDLVVIWSWHAPALHQLSRAGGAMLVLEQLSFLFAGLAVWLTAFSGSPHSVTRGAGIVGLLMTSMHMALLGGLLAVSPRPLYSLGCGGGFGLTALEDQHWGGVLMLFAGGSSYLAGGLYLLSRLLATRPLPP